MPSSARRRLGGLIFAFCIAIAAGSAHAQSPTLVLEPGGHSGPIRRIAVDAASGMVVTASADRTARVWSLEDGRLLRTLRPPLGSGSAGMLYGAAIRPGTRSVALAGAPDSPGNSSPIYLFDLDTGRMSGRIDTGSAEVKRLRWSPDGTLLAACFAGTNGLLVMDAAGRPLFRDTYSAPCYGLAFGADGRMAATAADGQVHLYRIRNSIPVRTRVIPTAVADPVDVAFSPDGTRIVVGYQSGRFGHSPIITSSTGDHRAPVVTMYDFESGETLHEGRLPNDPNGSLWAVAWSADGTTVFAGGRATARSDRDIVVVAFSALDLRRLSSTAVARAAITDFAPLGGDRVVWSSIDGSWGTADPSAAHRIESPRIADLRGAAQLRVDDAGRLMRWTFEFGERPAVFEINQRVLRLADDARPRPATPRRSLFVADNSFENVERPLVNGRAMAMAFGEVSRSLACLSRTGDCVLGTSRSIRRITRDGTTAWSVPVDTEAWAVHSIQDGRGIVSAHADGTIRWWRAEDGRHVLSLHASPDGRWIAWTPQGFFDASEGGERLAGWMLNRGPASESDFFPLDRFRDTYLRPDIVDRVLQTLDEALAISESDRLRSETAIAEAVALPVARPIEAASVPPVVVPAGPAVIATAGTRVRIPFGIRTSQGAAPTDVQIRVGAVKDPGAVVALPPSFDGSATGQVEVVVPAGESVVEIMVTDANGTSDPLPVRVRNTASVPPSQTRGKLFVVAVGTGRFQDASIPELTFAAKDAGDFADAIRAAAAGTFASIELRLRRESEATTRTVLSDVRWMVESVGPNDTLVLFLSGHGTTDDLDRYFFLSTDSRRDQLARTAVSGATVKALLAAAKGRAMLLLDTCKSGTIVSTALPGKRTTTTFVNGMSAPEIGAVVFSAGTGRQLALAAPEWNNSAFTKVVIDGLRGSAADDVTRLVTQRRLGAFVTRAVQVLTQDEQRPVVVSPPALQDFAIGMAVR